MTPEYIIKKLGLKPLEFEGGYYRENFISNKRLDEKTLNNIYLGKRFLYTSIYYLLTSDTISRIHRLCSDEIFHFYFGDPVLMLFLNKDKSTTRTILGNQIDKDQLPQVLVPAGTWQGSVLMDKGSFALMGTTMSPGFDINDFQAGKRDELIKDYPKEEKLIKRLTPPFADEE
jgi:predicted cupin superfamily sugar epimerase